jgi:hypothetical protein
MSEPKLLGSLVDYGRTFPYPYTDEQDRQFRRERVQQQAEAAEQDLGDLRSMAGKAFRGVYGETSKGVAIEWARFNSIPPDRVDQAHRVPLEELRKLLRKVPDRVSG